MNQEEYRNAIAETMLEKDLLSQVVKLAKTYQWRYYHTYNSRKSVAGFPDITLVRHGRLIFAELKRQDGRFRPGQREWLDDLMPVAEVHVWRPMDLLDGSIEKVLSGE